MRRAKRKEKEKEKESSRPHKSKPKRKFLTHMADGVGVDVRRENMQRPDWAFVGAVEIDFLEISGIKSGNFKATKS